MTAYVGLIGYPLTHSVSPAMQQAAFDYRNLDFRYVAWETEPSQLKKTLGRLRQASMAGANVTIPFKEVMVPLLDELDGLALQVNSVNTVVRRDGKLVGYNTDGGGFLEALRTEGRFEPEGKHVVLLGAGGAARGVSFALATAGALSLTLVNRTFERTEDLVLDLRRYRTEVRALPWTREGLERALAKSDLLVNCTSIGMKHNATEGQSPLDAALIPGDTLVCDIVYNPLETPLLTEAKKAGARTLGGLAMLVYQGALAFQLWTGEQAPVDIMLETARRAL
ncbi:MAG: shikimate dehydrogenase [Chloroflexota bacterium]